jgi:hypothetical protein
MLSESQGNLGTEFRSLVSNGTASIHGNVHGDSEQRLVGTELLFPLINMNRNLHHFPGGGNPAAAPA